MNMRIYRECSIESLCLAYLDGGEKEFYEEQKRQQESCFLPEDLPSLACTTIPEWGRHLKMMKVVIAKYIESKGLKPEMDLTWLVDNHLLITMVTGEHSSNMPFHIPIDVEK